MSSRMRSWWASSPADQDFLTADHPDVARLIQEIAPGSGVSDLGGWTSTNLHLRSAGLVMRVHQRFITRSRLLALHEVRRRLVDAGLHTPEPLAWRGQPLLTCRGRVVELEPFVHHSQRSADWESFRWMYRAMGGLHRSTAPIDMKVPRPLDSIYGPPSSLRRWMSVTEPAVRHDSEAAELAHRINRLVRSLRAQWIPATALPQQLIHGDIGLTNVGATPDHQYRRLLAGSGRSPEPQRPSSRY